jgi:hypothetical protein
MQTAPATGELILKIGTALLITFAATLVLVKFQIFFGSANEFESLQNSLQSF